MRILFYVLYVIIFVATGVLAAKERLSKMKNLIIYYSFTGNTKEAAIVLAEELNADIRRVEDAEEYSKFKAFTSGAFGALRGKCGNIKPVSYKLDGYERVFVGSPVWAGNPVPAMNTFIKNADFSGKEVVVFVTVGGSNYKGALEKLSTRIKAKGGKIIDSFAIQSGGKTKSEIIAKTKEILQKYK